MKEAKSITLPDFLTYGMHAVATIQKQGIAPNMAAIKRRNPS